MLCNRKQFGFINNSGTGNNYSIIGQAIIMYKKLRLWSSQLKRRN